MYVKEKSEAFNNFNNILIPMFGLCLSCISQRAYLLSVYWKKVGITANRNKFLGHLPIPFIFSHYITILAANGMMIFLI